MEILKEQDLDAIAKEALKIAEGDYKTHEPTARNHAALQARLVLINAELIKTIRHLDEKNGKLQQLIFWLSVVATAATIIAFAQIDHLYRLHTVASFTSEMA